MTNSGRQPSPAYVRYSPKLEQPSANEEEITQKLVDVLHRNNEWTFKKFKHGMRDAHAKSHAVLEGELVVEPDLPEHLRQGLFATPATYPVIARISSTQPTLHSDQIRGVRAIAIKVLAVEGPRAQEDGFNTQDFVMVDSSEFPFANAPRGFGEDAHRVLIADFFRNNDAEYEVCAQLCTDADAIEDATLAWSTSPPPQRVAKLIFPRQNSDCYCRRVYADDLLSFNSWRTLEAHRPLGSINRLKAKVHDASSKFRHEKNNAPQIEPSNISQLPSCPAP